MSNYYFSKTTLAFYPAVLLEDFKRAGTLPDDVKGVSDDIRNEFNASPPAGLKLGIDSKGMPAWVELDADEVIASNEQFRALRRLEADAAIAWRQDAVDAGMATETEKADLTAWKKYRVLLMRVNTALPDWPPQPD